MHTAVSLIIASEVDPLHRDSPGNRRFADRADHRSPSARDADLPRPANVYARELRHLTHNEASRTQGERPGQPTLATLGQARLRPYEPTLTGAQRHASSRGPLCAAIGSLWLLIPPSIVLCCSRPRSPRANRVDSRPPPAGPSDVGLAAPRGMKCAVEALSGSGRGVGRSGTGLCWESADSRRVGRSWTMSFELVWVCVVVPLVLPLTVKLWWWR
jgi:hypothetical protein